MREQVVKAKLVRRIAEVKEEIAAAKADETLHSGERADLLVDLRTELFSLKEELASLDPDSVFS